MLEVIFIIFLFGFDVFLIEILNKYFKISNFLTRKIGHILGALISLLMFYILNKPEFIFISILLTLVNLFSKVLNIFKSIEKVDEKSFGAILFPISVLLIGILFWENIFIFTVSILILGFADSIGAIAGKYFGKKEIKNFPPKTWEGFIAFSFVSIIIFSISIFVKFESLSFFDLILIISASIFLSFIELISKRGSDNFFITIFTGLFLYVVFF